MTRPADVDPVGRPTLRGGRFALHGKIADGGMASIFRAWDEARGDWCAVKVLLPEFAHRRRLRLRFEAEARAMAAISHPNVVRVYEVGTDTALPYFAMELADAGSLADWVEAHGAMPPRMALRCVFPIAQGLAAAHAVGVIHRDVKPQNVLLDRSGRCLVSDFGIARVEFLDSMTRTGTSMGTVGYMAPEQRTDARAVDVRADVYALGALLYKLLTSVVLTDMFMLGRDPELIDPVPLPLRPMLVKACEHDRNARYPDVTSFVADLERALPLLPEDPPGTPPLVDPSRSLPLDTSERAFASIASLFVGATNEGIAILPVVPPSRVGQVSTPLAPVETSGPPIDANRPSPASPPPDASPAAPVRPTVVTVRPERPTWSSVALASVTGASVVLLLALASGLWTVRAAQRQEVAARSALYSAIEADRPVLDLVSARSADPAALARLLAQHATFETTRQEPARQEAADAYVVVLLAETQPVVGEGAESTAAVQVRNLAASHLAWRTARDDLAAARSSAPGIWAAVLGF